MEDRNAYELAVLANCASPENLTSFGAMLLLGVQGSVGESIEYGETDEDAAYRIAIGAPNVYTYQLWLEFVDLAAWQEDVEEFGPIADLEEGARNALYLIAERLATVLFADLTDASASESLSTAGVVVSEAVEEGTRQ